MEGRVVVGKERPDRSRGDAWKNKGGPFMRLTQRRVIGVPYLSGGTHTFHEAVWRPSRHCVGAGGPPRIKHRRLPCTKLT